uniref:Uncharacterized protein n=1 Tax=Anguilla anguilla TaxID=7936 RepID=A0A0E9S320_ANGAN
MFFTVNVMLLVKAPCHFSGFVTLHCEFNKKKKN